MSKNIYWAITGKFGLYLGTWFTRTEAVKAHTLELGETWKTCYRKGDRAIKVKVIPLKGAK